MTLNGNGLENATGRQLLQVIPINIVTIITMITCAIGLYYKFDARISMVEKNSSANELMGRVEALERQIQAATPLIIRTDTNVQWLMSKEKKHSDADEPKRN